MLVHSMHNTSLFMWLQAEQLETFCKCEQKVKVLLSSQFICRKCDSHIQKLVCSQKRSTIYIGKNKTKQKQKQCGLEKIHTLLSRVDFLQEMLVANLGEFWK